MIVERLRLMNWLEFVQTLRTLRTLRTLLLPLCSLPKLLFRVNVVFQLRLEAGRRRRAEEGQVNGRASVVRDTGATFTAIGSNESVLVCFAVPTEGDQTELN